MPFEPAAQLGTKRIGESLKYALIVFHDSDADLSPQQIDEHPAHQAWLAEVNRRGVFAGGQRLSPADSARTVRSRGGRPLISDGPFIEAREQVGGIVLLDCADIDEAVELAGTHPFAELGAIEVRPVWT